MYEAMLTLADENAGQPSFWGAVITVVVALAGVVKVLYYQLNKANEARFEQQKKSIAAIEAKHKVEVDEINQRLDESQQQAEECANDRDMIRHELTIIKTSMRMCPLSECHFRANPPTSQS